MNETVQYVTAVDDKYVYFCIAGEQQDIYDLNASPFAYINQYRYSTYITMNV